jgi:hypothetical protein
MLNVEFEWDPAKAQANLRKHRVPFLMACEVFKDGSGLSTRMFPAITARNDGLFWGASEISFFLWSIHSVGSGPA